MSVCLSVCACLCSVTDFWKLNSRIINDSKKSKTLINLIIWNIKHDSIRKRGGCRVRPIIGIIGIGIGISVFLAKSVSVSVWYSYMKIGIGIGIVKSPKNRLESVSVRIGKGWIGLKDFYHFSRLIHRSQYMVNPVFTDLNIYGESSFYNIS